MKHIVVVLCLTLSVAPIVSGTCLEVAVCVEVFSERISVPGVDGCSVVIWYRDCLLDADIHNITCPYVRLDVFWKSARINAAECEGPQEISTSTTSLYHISPCEVERGGCEQLCSIDESREGYHCVCWVGILLENGKNCSGICSTAWANACEQVCFQLDGGPGSYKCGCYPGYMLADDERTCELGTTESMTTTEQSTERPSSTTSDQSTEIPSSTTVGCGCAQLCIPLRGTALYSCACINGFTLAPDLRSCEEETTKVTTQGTSTKKFVPNPITRSATPSITLETTRLSISTEVTTPSLDERMKTTLSSGITTSRKTTISTSTSSVLGGLNTTNLSGGITQSTETESTDASTNTVPGGMTTTSSRRISPSSETTMVKQSSQTTQGSASEEPASSMSQILSSQVTGHPTTANLVQTTGTGSTADQAQTTGIGSTANQAQTTGPGNTADQRADKLAATTIENSSSGISWTPLTFIICAILMSMILI